MKDALETLKGKPKVKRTMWSRRAQEYEAKINSGDLTSIAEVTRDLFRPDDAPEQSYSERQIFEAASSRLARELGAMEQTDEKSALAKILEILNKAAADPPQGERAGLSRSRATEAHEGRPSTGRALFFALAACSALCIAYANTPIQEDSMRKVDRRRDHSPPPPRSAAAVRRMARTPGATVSRNLPGRQFHSDRGRRPL